MSESGKTYHFDGGLTVDMPVVLADTNFPSWWYHVCLLVLPYYDTVAKTGQSLQEWVQGGCEEGTRPVLSESMAFDRYLYHTVSPSDFTPVVRTAKDIRMLPPDWVRELEGEFPWHTEGPKGSRRVTRADTLRTPTKRTPMRVRIDEDYVEEDSETLGLSELLSRGGHDPVATPAAGKAGAEAAGGGETKRKAEPPTRARVEVTVAATYQMYLSHTYDISGAEMSRHRENFYKFREQARQERVRLYTALHLMTLGEKCRAALGQMPEASEIHSTSDVYRFVALLRSKLSRLLGNDRNRLMRELHEMSQRKDERVGAYIERLDRHYERLAAAGSPRGDSEKVYDLVHTTNLVMFREPFTKYSMWDQGVHKGRDLPAYVVVCEEYRQVEACELEITRASNSKTQVGAAKVNWGSKGPEAGADSTAGGPGPKCWNCQEYGHRQKDCPKPKKGKNSGGTAGAKPGGSQASGSGGKSAGGGEPFCKECRTTGHWARPGQCPVIDKALAAYKKSKPAGTGMYGAIRQAPQDEVLDDCMNGAAIVRDFGSSP